MKKITPFDWFLYIAKSVGMLAVPTLLCGFIVSFEAAFQTWALILAFFIPFISGFLIILNYVWKNQRLAFFLRAVVIGISFFTTSVVGMAMDIRAASWRNFITSVVGITIDSQTSVWSQILSISAVVGVIGFVAVIVLTQISSSIRNAIKEFIRDVIREQ